MHKDNEKAIWKQIYCYTDNGFNDGESIKFRFKEGDKVRINKQRLYLKKDLSLIGLKKFSLLKRKLQEFHPFIN